MTDPRPPTDEPTSPFHIGERAAQTRAGIRARVERIGGRMIHDHLPPGLEDFLPQLPWIVLAATDGAGRPWASIMSGPPGFAYARDPQTVRLDGRLDPADPLARHLDDDAPLGLLAIELHTRRRNRVTGRVRADATGFTLRVEQAFGNCPRWVHPVRLAPVETPPGRPAITPGLDDRARAFIERADTFFIASVAPADDHSDPRRGADASHRGGPAGFVQVDGNALAFRDYPGNGFFNTIGNLLLEPRAGLTFVDFTTGDLLQLSGRAAVEWITDGRERAVRVQVEAAVYRPAGLPLRRVG